MEEGEGHGSADADAEFEGCSDMPHLIELKLHQVLAAALDPRADAWLQRAHRVVMATRSKLSHLARKQSFPPLSARYFQELNSRHPHGRPGHLLKDKDPHDTTPQYQ